MSTDKYETLRMSLADLQADLARRTEDSQVRKVSTESQLRRLIAMHEAKLASEAEQIKQTAAEEVAESQHKRAVQMRLIGVLSAIVVVAGGGTVTYSQLTPDKPAQPTAAEVVEAVDRAADKAGGKLEGKVQKLEDIATDQQVEIEATQVQLVDGIEYISDKIDRAHPRQAGDVPEPASFRAAKARKRKAAVRRKLLAGVADDRDE